jgi:Holliday junction resolvasome RuvABC endonuclease subunit
VVTVYDPARSRESEYKRNARSAIITTACDSSYNVYVLDYFAKRASLDVIFEALEKHIQQYHPRVLAVEDVATQIAIGDAFAKIARMRGVRLPPLLPLRPDTRINKKFRIRTAVQKILPYGQLFIQAHHYELKAELEAFPNGLTIDILDTLAYAIMLHNIPDSSSARDYNIKVKEALAAAHGIDNDDDDRRYVVPGPPKDLRAALRYA